MERLCTAALSDPFGDGGVGWVGIKLLRAYRFCPPACRELLLDALVEQYRVDRAVADAVLTHTYIPVVKTRNYK